MGSGHYFYPMGDFSHGSIKIGICYNFVVDQIKKLKLLCAMLKAYYNLLSLGAKWVEGWGRMSGGLDMVLN